MIKIKLKCPYCLNYFDPRGFTNHRNGCIRKCLKSIENITKDLKEINDKVCNKTV